MSSAKAKREVRTIGLAEELFGWIEALVFAVSILVIINSFILRTTTVDGESMFPTLHDGDLVLVSGMFYNQPQKGDIITFYSAGYWEEVLIKRIIGTQGDVVDIDYGTGSVSVNGEALDEPYINEKIRYKDDVEFPYTVPEGTVFVMGDNRNHSTDSRSGTVGPVRLESIVGKMVFRLFPFNRIGIAK